MHRGNHRMLSHGLILLVLAIVVVAVLAGHGMLFKGVAPHLALPVGGLAVVIGIAVLLHLGVLGVLFAWLRRHLHGPEK